MTQAKILIVEDDPAVSRSISRSLEGMGFTVTGSASTAEQALDAAKLEAPDLVLMDIGLPGEMDGVEAARQIRFETNTPVVFLTGFADEKTLERAKVAEPLGYLVKPFDLKELQTTVKSALRHLRTSNIRTQEVLHQTEEKYRAMFENLPVGIYRTTPEGRILDANTAFIQMLGYPDRQSLLTANIHDIFVQPEDRRRWQAMLEREKTVRDFKTQLRRYDGTTILVLDNARGVPAADGRIQYYEGSLLDITERKQAEEALRLSEERFRLAAESISDVVYESDMCSSVQWFGDIDKLLGYAPGEFPRTLEAWSDIIHPNDRERVWTAIERHLRGEAAYDVEYRVRHKDGAWRHWLARATVLRDGGGKPSRWVGAVKDITERRQAEEALRRMAAIIESSDDAVISETLSGAIASWNPGAEKIFGYSAQETLGRSILMLIPPERAKGELDVLQRIRQGENIDHFETVWLRKGGEPIHVSVTISPVKNAQGEILGLSVIARDITDRKHMEDALSENEARLTSVINASQDGILMIDDQGLTVLWNPAAERITGYTAAEVLGRNLFDLIVPERVRGDHKNTLLSWGRTGLTCAGTEMVEMPCVRKDGTEISIELSLSFVEPHGRRTAVGVIRDITERQRAQKERDLMEVMLRQAQKLESIGQLAAGIAHEINTPTQYVGDNTRFIKDAFGELQGALQAYARLLSACKKGSATPELVEEVESEVKAADLEYISEEIPKAIGQTLEGIDRVATIVRAMKEFSHPGTKERTPTNIHKAIESTLIVCRNEYKYVAEVATDFDPSMPLVPCIPGDFNQVILNLVINAAHAIADKLGPESPSKGMITIKTIRDGNWAEIRVSDTGTGIPEAARSRIFDPFFTTKEVGKGTGQGLAICHGIVVGKHGGTITFETELGKGTTFIVRLPLD